MKSILIHISLLLFLSGSCLAQKISAGAVPAPVKEAFAKAYPGIACKWEKERGQFEAGFKKDGKLMSILLDADGKITETEVAISLKELPAAALAYLGDQYKGIQIKESSKITLADGTIHYEAAVSGKDLIFDRNGKFIKAVKD